jgi:superoxide dismutase
MDDIRGDYGAKAAAYVDAFVRAIDWPSVGRRLDACR